MTTTGYKDLSGNDLSTLFDTYVTGIQANPTGYQLITGADLNTRFAKFVTGTPVAATGYKISTGADLSTVFAPPPNFPTKQSSVLNIGTFVYANTDGTTCVFATQGSSPAGDTHSYLYWSDDFGATLNKAKIGGSVVKFFGCVAIDGEHAIAMGRLTQAGTNNFYLSSDAGKTYTVTTTSGQLASGRSGGYVDICINGTNAVWSGDGNLAYYSTNYGATWSQSTGSSANVQMRMFGTNVLLSCFFNGFYYSTNSGQTYTKNTNVVGAVGCATQIGINIYLGVANGQCMKLTGNAGTGMIQPGSIPTVTATLTGIPGGAGPSWVINIAGCPRSGGGDFLLIDDQGVGNQYSNDSGVNFQTTGVNLNSLTFIVTATRIISGSGGSNLYWGKNAYIT